MEKWLWRQKRKTEYNKPIFFTSTPSICQQMPALYQFPTLVSKIQYFLLYCKKQILANSRAFCLKHLLPLSINVNIPWPPHSHPQEMQTSFMADPLKFFPQKIKIQYFWSNYGWVTTSWFSTKYLITAHGTAPLISTFKNHIYIH